MPQSCNVCKHPKKVAIEGTHLRNISLPLNGLTAFFLSLAPCPPLPTRMSLAGGVAFLPSPYTTPLRFVRACGSPYTAPCLLLAVVCRKSSYNKCLQEVMLNPF
jgi:hypothetical protein